MVLLQISYLFIFSLQVASDERSLLCRYYLSYSMIWVNKDDALSFNVLVVIDYLVDDLASDFVLIFCRSDLSFLNLQI